MRHALVCFALAGCTPFSPDLGGAPYLCADVEPKCPDDYTCKDDGGGRMVCVSANGDVPDASGSFQCSPYDGPPLEPNDTKDQAYQTDVSPTQARRYGPLAICPTTDRDHFQINITTPNKGIEAIVSWDSGSPVSVSILAASGSSLSDGKPMGEKASRACVANATSPTQTTGSFYVVAYATQLNNYTIDMRLVDACE